MEESGAALVLRVFVGLKRILRKVFDFVCNRIVHQRRMVKSIYDIKKGLSRPFCSEMLLEIGENTYQQ